MYISITVPIDNLDGNRVKLWMFLICIKNIYIKTFKSVI